MNAVSVRCASCGQCSMIDVTDCHVVYLPPIDGHDTARLWFRCTACHGVDWLTLPGIETRIKCEELGITRFDWSDSHPAGCALLEHAINIWLRPELRIRVLEAELERILEQAEQ